MIVPSPRDRWLAAAGLVGGAIWIALGLAPIDELSEVFWNRAWAPALVLMAAGFIGLRRSAAGPGTGLRRIGLGILVGGLLVMAVGNIAEYWLFVSQPHGEVNLRNASWMGLLAGALAAAIGGSVAGVAVFLRGSAPGWVGLPLAGLLPATAAIGAVDIGWTGVPLGVAAVAVGIHGLRAPAGQESSPPVMPGGTAAVRTRNHP
jgi:hypothetical protein